MSAAEKDLNVCEEELFERETEFMEAVKERDVAYLDQMLGENFVLTTGRAGAEICSRQEWLEVTRQSYRSSPIRSSGYASKPTVTLPWSTPATGKSGDGRQGSYRCLPMSDV